MISDNDINNISDQEKLINFHKKSAAILEKMVDDGKTTLALADEMDLPYHIFDLYRTVVQGVNTFLVVNKRTITGEELNKSEHKDFERLNKLEQLSSYETIQYLHREIRGKVYTWKIYGQWLLNWFEERLELSLPTELKDWCLLSITGTEKIQELFTTIFNLPTIDFEKPDKALLDMRAHWQSNEVAKFPILGKYGTYSNALKEIAQKLKLSLFERIQWDDISAPSGYIKLFSSKRRVQTRIQSNSSKQSYGEYILTLQWRTKDRYQTWQGYSSISPSLEDVVSTLQQWLVNDWDLNSICQEYHWMQEAVIDTGLHPTVLPKNLSKTSGSNTPLDSIHDLYETDVGEKLILEATQDTTDIQQEINHTKRLSILVSGLPAYYIREDANKEKNNKTTENGMLTWSESGIIYKIIHSDLKLSVNEVIQIAEGLRWVFI